MLARTLPRGSRSTPSVFNRPSCTGCTKPIASSTRSAGKLEFAAGDQACIRLSSTWTPCSLAHLAVVRREKRPRQHGEFALGAFLLAEEVRIFSGQFGQVRPLFSRSGGCRHDLELGHRGRALPERGADAVRAGVAAADHDDMLALGENRRRAADGLVADAAVLLRQEVHREMNAGEIAAGDRQVARGFRAAGQRQRVIVVQHLARVDRAGVPPTWAP